VHLGYYIITNRKSYTGSRLPPNSMTLDDFERQNRGFMDFLAISGCDTSLYHPQGGATENRYVHFGMTALKVLYFIPNSRRPTLTYRWHLAAPTLLRVTRGLLKLLVA